MTTQGPNYPSTTADDATIGTVVWGSTANVGADDGSYATATAGAGTISHYLKATNLGFSLGAGTITILGVTVEFQIHASRTNGVKDTSVKLVKGGAISGSDLAGSTIVGTVDTTITRGGAANMWGLALTQADVEASTFGVVISLTENAGATTTLFADFIRVTITYSVASTVTADIATAGVASRVLSRDITTGGEASQVASRDVTTGAIASRVLSRDIATAGVAATTLTCDVTTGGIASRALSRDVATAGVAVNTGQRDIATGGVATTTNTRDVATAGVATAVVTRDILTAGESSRTLTRDVVTGAIASRVLTADIATAGVATAVVARDIATAAIASQIAQRDIVTGGNASQVAMRDVATGGVVVLIGLRDVATAGVATAPAFRDLNTAGVASRAVTRDLVTGGISSRVLSRDVVTGGVGSRTGTRDILTAGVATLAGFSDNPPLSIGYKPPIVRLYDGSYATSPGGVLVEVPANTRGASAQSKLGTQTIALGSDTAVEVGDLLVVGLAWLDHSFTLTTIPSGWTIAGSVNTSQTGGCVLYYRTATSLDVGTPLYTWGLSSALPLSGNLWRVRGAASSPLDKTASGSVSNASHTASSWTFAATTAAIASAPQLTFAVGVGNGITGDVGLDVLADGLVIDSAQKDGTGFAQFAHREESAISAKTATMRVFSTAGLSSFTFEGQIAIATFKADTGASRFAAIGQFDLADGQATRRPYDLGEFSLKLSKADPLTASVVEGSILEFYIPSEPAIAGHTFEWYIVRHLEDFDDDPDPYLAVSGPDLRAFVNNYALADAVIGTVRGTPPANKSVENWVRAYITNTAITPAGTSDFSTSDKVPGLALEASSGNRGTVYADPPAGAGAPLVSTISTLYKADGLGWRIVITNPGTSTGALEVQTFAAVDRRFGVGAGEAVFAAKWDTAKRVTRMRDAVNAVTALTLLGPASGSVRPTYYAEDAIGRQRWGFLHGRVDGSNVTYPTTDVAATMVAERAPKEWCEIDGRETTDLRLFRDYDLLDIVSAITSRGIRFDGRITSLTIYTTGTITEGSSDWAQPELFGLNPPDSVPAPRVATTPPFVLTVGNTPDTSPEGRTKDAIALSQYTYLPGLTSGAGAIDIAASKMAAYTGTGASLNDAVDTVSAPSGTVQADKAVIPDSGLAVDQLKITTLKAGAGTTPVADGATANPTNAASAAANKTTALGSQSVSDSGFAGAASTATTQAAIDAVQAKLDALITRYNAVLDALKTTGGAKVIAD